MELKEKGIEYLDYLSFADDTALLTDSYAKAKIIDNIFVRKMKENGIEINKAKTEVMIVAKNKDQR